MSFLPQINNETEDSLTQQHFKNDCDINHVVNKYFKTGVLETIGQKGKNLPKYGDFTKNLDYQEALHAVRDAEAQFKNLSAKVRKRFNNNPGEFLRFMENPENLDEAVSLGLAEVQKPSPPIEEKKT